jgi:hypothetical protein
MDPSGPQSKIVKTLGGMALLGGGLALAFWPELAEFIWEPRASTLQFLGLILSMLSVAWVLWVWNTA